MVSLTRTDYVRLQCFKANFLCVFISLFLTSCSNIFDTAPVISVTFNDVPVENEITIVPGVSYTLSITVTSNKKNINTITIESSDSILYSYNLEDDLILFQSFNIFEPPIRGSQQTISINAFSRKGDSTTFPITIKLFESTPPILASNLFEQIIPEIEISDGGVQSSPIPSGTVYYFNPLHTVAESDIQLSNTIKYTQTVKRYMEISGIAVTDDSGYSDRHYHWVTFSTNLLNSSNQIIETTYITFPVDSNNYFSGYLYFPKVGNYNVYAYRQYDYNLYPRGVGSIVGEGYGTLYFKVSSITTIPDNLLSLLPSKYVDCGNSYIREYAKYITQFNLTDLEKIQSLYNFMAFGDSYGQFRYSYYKDIYPNYIDPIYSDLYIASHFLINRIGVCNDYSELFTGLARSLGFQVQKVSGYNSSNIGHQWNKILIDGTWYRLDSTWGNSNNFKYKTYAEFYPEFNSSLFTKQHEDVYTNSFTETW